MITEIEEQNLHASIPDEDSDEDILVLCTFAYHE
jgi:hypothetical protein